MEDSGVLEGNLLPAEILLTIFEYLPVKDINSASITCKHWYNVSLHSTVMDRRILVLKIIDTIESNENYCRLNLIKENFYYKNLKIDHTLNANDEYQKRLRNKFSFNRFNSFWPKKNPVRQIFEFLIQFEYLNTLHISFAIEPIHLNFDECWFETYNLRERDQSSIQLKSLKIFKINLKNIEAACYLTYLLDLMPELVHIDINLKGTYSCTRKKLLKYLIDGKNRIKTLILNADCETEEFISTINGMNLESLSFGTMIHDHYLNLTDPKKLLHLSIPSGTFVDGKVDLKLFPNLETISISYAGDIKGIEELKKLKNLKVKYVDDDLANCLSEYNSNVLENLYLDCNSFVRDLESSTLSFLKSFKNLTHLSCYDMKLTDRKMQDICKNLKQLKHIAMTAVNEDAELLTDFGFTGEPDGHSISSLEHLKLLHIEVDVCKIGERTVSHILKIKGLEYLYITCNQEEYGRSFFKEFEKKRSIFLKRADFFRVYEGYDKWIEYEQLPKTQKFNKVFPLNEFID